MAELPKEKWPLNLGAPHFASSETWIVIPASWLKSENFFHETTTEGAIKCAQRAAQGTGEDVYLFPHPVARVYAPTPNHPTGQD